MSHKIVFDTNVLVSAIVFGGNPKVCLELARQKKINAFTSKTLLLELARTLHRKFQWPDDEIQNSLRNVTRAAIIITPQMAVREIKDDLSDNAVLEATLAARADYIISGDKKHLLSLKKFENIPIISAADFLKSL